MSLDKKYRLDFAIFSKLNEGDKESKVKICIECDGHDYHKTKEQRTKDSNRDRQLILDGWTVFRFTGTEIFSKDNCAHDLEQFLYGLSIIKYPLKRGRCNIKGQLL